MRTFFIVTAFLFCTKLHAQFPVKGVVYDSSKLNYVENVRVVSTSGIFALTDSMGRYEILVNNNDSLSFYYNNKPTQKFAVKQIADAYHFDISLRIKISTRYSVLKEVMVYSKTYQQDSLENRQAYKNVFDYTKPGVKSSLTPGGGAGADLNELINIFRFKRNKQIRSFQRRLQEQEKEKYVNYRFNKMFVKRVTGLQNAALDSFMVWYRPTYEFTITSNEVVFNQYVLNSYYRFKRFEIISGFKQP